MDAVGLQAACRDADVVITGEGRFDWQSLRGKAVSGVLRLAPGAVILAGAVALQGHAAYSLLDFCGQRALTEPAAALADLAAHVACGFMGGT
jgi:glycerate kinase